MGGSRDTIFLLKSMRSLFIVIAVPIIALPFILSTGNTTVGRCAYGLTIVAIYWVTEALPLPVTSILPVFLFPVLGVVTAPVICSSYMKDTIMLFLGSLIVAVGVEVTNLHKRIAVRVLLFMGTDPKWLMAGIMLPTWFLSMWMSNTATTAMMVTIVNAILVEIKHVMLDEKLPGQECDNEGMELDRQDEIEETQKSATTTQADDTESDDYKEFLNLAKSFSIALAYAANTGGIATLTGTPPNIVFKGQADDLFAKYGIESGITFASWMVVGIPISILLLVLTWLWLQIYFFPSALFPCVKKKPRDFSSVRPILQREYAKLGSISFGEVVVLIHFIVLALLWISRKPGFVDGWDYFFKPGYVKDSTPAILIAVLLFIMPSSIPFMKSGTSYNCTGEEEKGPRYTPILTWKVVNEKLPWGVLLLMGGGFAIADAAVKSGLSDWISNELKALGVLSPWVIVLILTIIVAATTELTSNTATVSILLPIVSSLAESLQIHPLYFMIPTTLATSFAFMLPVATPPNAIVFSTGYLKVWDMAKCGFTMNIVSVIILNLAINTWGKAFFDIDSMPPEMIPTTTTSAVI